MLGCTFTHKLLVEAITHTSYQFDRTYGVLGDSALEIVLSRRLYHCPGKYLSHDHRYIRKSAVVNIHFLVYIC
ncbi:hypothetical protein EDB19DRAFT_1581311, partial [Suillus lakei]